MARLLHLADVHLGATLGGFEDEADARAAEVLDAFRHLPRTAESRDVDAVLIAGDLFDGPRPSDTVVIAVRETIRALGDRSIPVFAVPGNHDARALNPDLYPRALEGATIFTTPRFGEPVTVPVGSEHLHLYGIGHDPAEEPDPLSTFRRDSTPGIHVVLLHGSTPGAPHWESGSSLQLAWDALRDLGADYLALGDLHRYRGPDELEGLPACYPGSFAAVDFTESGLRGPVLVELAPGRPPVLQRLSSGVREVGAPLEVDVSGHTADAEVADAVSAALESDAYAVVELRGEPSFALDAGTVRAILVERHGAARVVDRSRFFDLARLEEIGRRNTVAGHIVRLGVARAGEVESESERRAIERGLRMALRALEVE